MKFKVLKITAWSSIDVEAESLDVVMDEVKRVCGVRFFNIVNPETERIFIIKADEVNDFTMKEYKGTTAESAYFKGK